MDIKYANLNELLQSDDGAYELYNSLPDYIQNILLEQGDSINNYNELTKLANKVEKAL